MRRRLTSLGIAVAIVCVAFPEVVFLGGSLSPVGLTDTLTPFPEDPRVRQACPVSLGRMKALAALDDCG